MTSRNDRLRCDCDCNKDGPPCFTVSGRCGHIGCGWNYDAGAEHRRKAIDAGLTRSFKPPDKPESPSDATRKSPAQIHQRVKLLADKLVVGKETITLEQYLKETNEIR